jgi:undecaprenyl-diphosphatase
MEFLNLLKSWDKALFLYLNGIHSPLWDYTMTLFTLTSTWLLFYGLIFFIVGKKYDKKSLFIFVSLAFLILCSDQLAGLLKHSIQRLRPSNDPLMSPLTHVFFNKGGEYGFVSAHAANLFAFATFSIKLFKNNRFTLFILFWAALVAYSRIYLGLHYPGDILGGILLGVVVGSLIYKLLKYSESKLSPVNLFARNPMKDKEANQIIGTGLFIMVMCIGVIALLLQNGLLAK